MPIRNSQLLALSLLVTLSGCTAQAPIYAPNVGNWASAQVNQSIGQTVSNWEYRQATGLNNHRRFEASVQDLRDAIAALRNRDKPGADTFESQLTSYLMGMRQQPIDWRNQYMVNESMATISRLHNAVTTALNTRR